MLYSINEIFYSIQGEGRNTGMPAWFIRFAGCNLNCSWCDTDYTEWTGFDEDLILKSLSNSCKNVVITGGEPSIQNLRPLLKLLKTEGYYIALETNGTNNLLKYRIEGLLDWLTVSPKELPIKVDCIIDEVKLVWPIGMELEKVGKIKADYYYLQPLDNHKKDLHTKMVSEIVLKNPKWRLSLQVQKIIGVK